MQVLLGKPFHGSRPLDIRVFLWFRKQRPRFAQGHPKGYFQLKQLHKTTKTYCSNECWLKGEQGPVCWVQCANMWHDCSLTAVQRKTAFVEQSWWPELNLFGSMPWCSFPRHKILPRLAQKNCCINLIDEFTSFFSRNVIYAGLFGKAFPRKQAFVDISVFLWLGKRRPRFAKGQPTGLFQMKELDIKNLIEPLKLLSQWMTGGESWIPTCHQYVPLRASMGQHCSLSAVQRKTAFVEPSWWPELNLFGSMRWCSFPWHKLLPRLAQENCGTV